MYENEDIILGKLRTNREQLDKNTNKTTYVDVLKYGEVVNSESIQACINGIKGTIPSNPYELKSDGKYIIQLPKGVFTLTTEINVPSYIKIKGYGRASTIIKLQGCNGFNFGSAEAKSYNFGLEGLTIDGQDKTTRAIRVIGARFILTDVCVTNCDVAIDFYGGFLGDIYSTFIQYCNTGVIIDGLDNGTGSHAIHFYGGEIEGCTDYGVKLRFGNACGLFGTTIESCGIGVYYTDDAAMSAFTLDNIYFEDNSYDIKGLEIEDSNIMNCFFGFNGKLQTDYYIATNKLRRTSIINNSFGVKTNNPEISTISTTQADIVMLGCTIIGNSTPTSNFEISPLFVTVLETNDVNDTNYVSMLTGGIQKVLSGLNFRNYITFRRPIRYTSSTSQSIYRELNIDVNGITTVVTSGTGTSNATYKLSRFVSVPATATTAGISGDWSADANYLYVCHSLNSWKRTAIATW